MLRAVAISLSAAVALTPLPALAFTWKSGDTAALLGGALLGGAVVAATSNQRRYPYQYAPPPPPPPAYGPRRAPFSPVTGVICYPAQSACYNNNGQFNAAWTNRVF